MNQDHLDWTVWSCMNSIKSSITFQVVEISNLVFSTIFTIEMILKVSAYGIIKYVGDGFNVFDGFIVILRYAKITDNNYGTCLILGSCFWSLCSKSYSFHFQNFLLRLEYKHMLSPIWRCTNNRTYLFILKIKHEIIHILIVVFSILYIYTVKCKDTDLVVICTTLSLMIL